MRHSLINDIINRGLSRAKIPASREPAGLMPGTSLRPDGASLIPWARGKCLAWDATCADTVAPSHIGTTSALSGAAACYPQEPKVFCSHSNPFFIPVAVETVGPWNEDGLSFTQELVRRMSLATGDLRET